MSKQVSVYLHFLTLKDKDIAYCCRQPHMTLRTKCWATTMFIPSGSKHPFCVYYAVSVSLRMFSYIKLQQYFVMEKKRCHPRGVLVMGNIAKQNQTATWIWSKSPGHIPSTDSGMCSFAVSFLGSACVCDLCRVRLWRLPSLLSSQAHNVTLAFIVPPSPHTHCHTCPRIFAYTRHTWTYAPLPHCHCGGFN